ncbi:MAG TPA: response regulator [Rhizomicrobium sp.]|jgi:PAS domain S-box-containing protein|nr:response regulator [Rhizomicrobium sp.]
MEEPHEKINILLVDDQPAKLISYDVMLSELNENIIKASSAREAFEHLLKNDIAVLLVDVCMPELDGFELAAMIREHPRFQKTAIIFVSAIHMADDDRLRGYRMGAVDYMPVPVVPDILRAKVKVFAELYRKTRQLEQLNSELERRVIERTAELEASNARLTESEKRRSMALTAGRMGAWDWDLESDTLHWNDEHFRIIAADPETFRISVETIRPLVYPDDWKLFERVLAEARGGKHSFQFEVRFKRLDGEKRWCIITAAASFDGAGRLTRLSGVTSDITERKEAEERHALLAREVDHRAKNALALVQSILRLTRAGSMEAYTEAVEGRIAALSHAHTLLSESRWQGADLRKLVFDELAPYEKADLIVIDGPPITLNPATAQCFALVLHELATNSAKYGSLSTDAGKLSVAWAQSGNDINIMWTESDGPSTEAPKRRGFGLKVITATVEGQLRGKVELDWRASGLCCRIAIPGEAKSETTNGHVPESIERPQSSGARKPVLLVEDEVIVGLALKDALIEIGLDAIGPYGNVRDVMAAVRANDLAAAILDVNLGGETVYEVAELLTNRHVPFIFVTGYDRESIDARFRNVPLLRKPVDHDDLARILRDRILTDSDFSNVSLDYREPLHQHA